MSGYLKSGKFLDIAIWAVLTVLLVFSILLSMAYAQANDSMVYTATTESTGYSHPIVNGQAIEASTDDICLSCHLYVP